MRFVEFNTSQIHSCDEFNASQIHSWGEFNASQIHSWDEFNASQIHSSEADFVNESNIEMENYDAEFDKPHLVTQS